MNINKCILLAIIQLLYCYSNAQSKEVILLKKGYIDLVNTKVNSGHIPSLQLDYTKTKDYSSFILPALSEKYYIFESNIETLLPRDNFLFNFYKKYNKKIFVLVEQKKDAFELRFDENFNNNFKDDSIIVVAKNQSKYWISNFIIDSINNISFPLPIEISILNKDDNSLRLSVKNLLKYSLNYIYAKDTLNIDFLTGSYYINFQYNDLVRSDSNNINSNIYRLNEPFFFSNKWWKFENLDLLKSTIELIPILSDKIYGYESGFYIRLDKLKELTNSNLLYENKIDWSKKFYLLHFWGDWCQPCLSEIPKMKVLNEKIQQNKVAEMIHYPIVSRDSLISKLKNFITKNELSKIQSVNTFDYFRKCMALNPASYINEDYDINALVRNYIFPRYILLNREGKILFRGDLDKDLYSKLEELKITAKSN